MNYGFQVLFLGCSDLLNALTTIASKVDDGCCLMTIHLSHPSILTFARNVVILKVVSAPLFNVDNANDLSYLWDLWYNVAWPQTTLERFVKDVEGLVKEGIPELHSLDTIQLGRLKNVWESWLLALKGTLTQPSQMKNISKDR